MATTPKITIGYSVTPSYVDGSERSGPSLARDLELTSGSKPADQVVSVPASTPTTDTTLWTAANNGAAATAPSCDYLVAVVDPSQLEDSDLPVGFLATYTQYNSTTTQTETVYEQWDRSMGPKTYAGTACKSDDTLMYLTKLVARNRNTGTSDAVGVRVQVWA